MAYLTVTEVTNRLLGSPYQTEWEALSLAQQEYGIKQATRFFNNLMFEGWKVDILQEDLFPRKIQRNACVYEVQINDDLLQGIAIESMYQGANKTQDTILLNAKSSIKEEWEDDTKVIYGGYTEGTQYLGMNFKSFEACKLIYPYTCKTARY